MSEVKTGLVIVRADNGDCSPKCPWLVDMGDRGNCRLFNEYVINRYSNGSLVAYEPVYDCIDVVSSHE